MNWGELLVDALQGKPDKIPTGWSSCADISEELGECKTGVRAKLRARIRQEKVERKDFRVLINGRIQTIPHYREKK